MIKKNKLGMLLTMAALHSSSDMLHGGEGEPVKNTEENLARLKADRQHKKKQRLLSRGVNEYLYGNTKIYAINRKNADRKAKKLGIL